jgi:hypothetical protein
MQIPARKMVVGNPAQIVKDVSDDLIGWKTKGTQLYQQLPKDCFETMEEVEPLREVPVDRPSQEALFETLNEFLKK